jgi:hypothetical protein
MMGQAAAGTATATATSADGDEHGGADASLLAAQVPALA